MKSLPAMPPVFTGRVSTLPSAPITITYWPCGPVCTARCGTRMRVDGDRLGEADAHEHARQDVARGVGKFRAQRHRAGARVHGEIGEQDAPGRARRRVPSSSTSSTLADVGRFSLPAFDGLLQAQQVARRAG